jgi:hypothetical protein
MLVDQEVIDNYLWYQNMLEQFEQQKIEVLESITSFGKFLKMFESRKDENILFYTRIKKALKENKETLSKVERNIEELREIVERNKHLEDRK